MRVFKTKWFARYAKRAGIDDNTLCRVVERTQRGLIDADLGANVLKQRISKDSKGYRSLIAYQAQRELCFFIYLRKMNVKTLRTMNWHH